MSVYELQTTFLYAIQMLLHEKTLDQVLIVDLAISRICYVFWFEIIVTILKCSCALSIIVMFNSYFWKYVSHIYCLKVVQSVNVKVEPLDLILKFILLLLLLSLLV